LKYKSKKVEDIYIYILKLWFHASQFNVNKNPTRCNSMQIFIHCTALNKYLHTVASGWIFINIEDIYIYRIWLSEKLKHVAGLYLK